jgi:hypothetical protein
MSFRKAFATLVILFVLGVQAWTILPPGAPARSRHWPFMDYPMYAVARHVGDSLVRYDLRVHPCEPGARAVSVSGRELRLGQSRLPQMLEMAARESTERDERPLAAADTIRILVRRVKPQACSFQIWRQVLVMTAVGMRDFDRPWDLVREYADQPPGVSDGAKDSAVP